MLRLPKRSAEVPRRTNHTAVFGIIAGNAGIGCAIRVAPNHHPARTDVPRSSENVPASWPTFGTHNGIGCAVST